MTENAEGTQSVSRDGAGRPVWRDRLPRKEWGLLLPVIFIAGCMVGLGPTPEQMRYVGDMIRCDTEFCYDECSLGERQAGALKRIPQGYEKKCLSERGWSFWKTPAGVVRLGGSPGGSPTCGCSDPTTIRGFVQRGDYYKNKGRDEDALSDYRRAVEVDARSPDDFFHKGKVYEGLGRSWEALRAYRLFLEEAGDYSANYGPLIEQARERVGELEK